MSTTLDALMDLNQLGLKHCAPDDVCAETIARAIADHAARAWRQSRIAYGDVTQGERDRIRAEIRATLDYVASNDFVRPLVMQLNHEATYRTLANHFAKVGTYGLGLAAVEAPFLTVAVLVDRLTTLVSTALGVSSVVAYVLSHALTRPELPPPRRVANTPNHAGLAFVECAYALLD